MNSTRISAVAAAAAAAVALGVSVAYVTFLAPGTDERFAACSQSNTGGAAIGGPFTLVDETGRTVTDADVFDKPSLLYFGYTFCPDVCPFDAARNAEAVELMAEQGVEVKPVFISIDPDRDTPEILSEWTDYIHPEMLGLTGTPEQVKAASQAYRTYYKKQEPEDPNDEFYLVDHTVFTYLVLPEIGFVEFFRRETTPEEMAERTMCFIEAAG